MSIMNFSTLARTVSGWLHEAGNLTIHLMEQGYRSELKQDVTPVTEIDHAVEAFLHGRLTESFPDHAIWGEEQGRGTADSDYTWLIDPIDGTRALMAGFPTFTILLALTHRESALFGAIYQPITGELWLGQSGELSLRNEIPIRARNCTSFEKAIFSTTSPFLFEPSHRAALEDLAKICHACQFGGDGYAYAKLASGTVDLVIESGLKPYDFMALIPIIEGAGGKITDWKGRPLTLSSGGKICAAGDPRLHALALKYLGALDR